MRKGSPEESVRQALLDKMQHQLGFPQSLLLTEKKLTALPHIQDDVTIPMRRFDIICMAKGLHPEHAYYPLLMVECKAGKLDKEVMRQVVGYNRFIQAFFVAIANPKEFYLGRFDGNKGQYVFSCRFPSYETLLEEARCQVI